MSNKSTILTSRDMWPAISGLLGLDGRRVTNLQVEMRMSDAVRVRCDEIAGEHEGVMSDEVARIVHDMAKSLRQFMVAHAGKVRDIKAESAANVRAARVDAVQSQKEQIMRIQDRLMDSVENERKARAMPKLLRWWYGIE